MNESSERVARILRADRDTVLHIEQKMSVRFGLKDAIENVYAQNQERIKAIHKQLDIEDHSALQMYNALIQKIAKDDEDLRRALGNPICGEASGCDMVLGTAKKITRVGRGFFMKWQKAEEFLRANPPKNIISFLGYKNIDELLAKEDAHKVYAALRFAEDRKWLNEVFFKAYKNLRPEDFENRYAETIVMDDKYVRMAEKFMEKKYHNVSHLKELGLIFVLPQHLGVVGEALRLLMLSLHYFYEMEFYSHLFAHYAENERSESTGRNSFADLFISSLRGDVLDERLPNKDQINWMIVQSYLAKDDENDWRLFEPHVNPEALHWAKAEEDISHMGNYMTGVDLSFWHGLGFVGDFYKSDTGIDVLVSFNLIDTAMSLVQRKELIKYLYHHQEALWNKIFAAYTGEDEMRNLIIKNFHKGYIHL